MNLYCTRSSVDVSDGANVEVPDDVEGGVRTAAPAQIIESSTTRNGPPEHVATCMASGDY